MRSQLRTLAALVGALALVSCDSRFEDVDLLEPDVPDEDVRTPIRSLGLGRSHACAVAADGALYCWGEGPLGLGTRSRAYAAARVAPSIDFLAVTADRDITCALDRGGLAYCWGVEFPEIYGGLRPAQDPGAPTRPYVNTPRPVATSHAFVEIRAVSEVSARVCGLDASGTIWCWGSGGFGENGTGSHGPTSEPTPVAATVQFVGLDLGSHHACGLDRDRRGWCWGSNEHGQLGTVESLADCAGASFGCATRPVPVTGERSLVQISTGHLHSCGLTTGGEAWCWGWNGGGQLGTGDFENSAVPRPVDTDMRFETIDAGAWHTCALSTDGRAWCWGNANVGMLGTTEGLEECGISPNRCSTRPVPVSGGFVYSAIAVGWGFTCAVEVGGVARCWGADHFGMLGRGLPVGFGPVPEPFLGQR